MKTMIESKVVAVFRILFVAVGCLGILCCSGEGHSSLPGVPATPAVPSDPDALCAVTPNSIEISSVDVSETPLTRSATGEPEQKVEYSANLGHNFSVEGTLEAVPEEPQTRASVLGNDVQYRMVVYDNTYNSVVGNVVYKVGSTKVVSGTAIRLKEGIYRLFCYSFNSTSAIKDLDAGNQNVTVKAGEDFMTYTEATFTIGSTDSANGKKEVAISFVRQCAKLTVTVKAAEYPDNTISDASLTLSGEFGDTRWDGVANDDNSAMTTAYGPVSLIKGSVNGVSVDCGKDASTPYASVAPFTSQTVTVTNLTAICGSREVKMPAAFNFPNSVTLAKGRSYRLTISLAPYYVLTPTNPVTIGGIRWARTNLQQTSGGDSPVSFVVNPWDPGSYWSWGIRDATRFNTEIYLHGNGVQWIAISGANADPCRAQGSGWQMPTQSDLNSLIDNKAANGTKVKINDVVNTVNSYGWADNAKCTVFISNSQVLALPSGGYRAMFGKVEDKGINGHLSTSTSSGEWTTPYLLFSASGLGISEINRAIGQSVRCVQK